jgi:hypothetical protein
MFGGQYSSSHPETLIPLEPRIMDSRTGLQTNSSKEASRLPS